MKTKSFFCCAILSIVIVSCVKEPQPIRVSSITLNSSSLELVEGESADLVATISPKDADNQTVIWSSTNGSVASVSNGKITALAPGSTTITAKSDDGGFTASCSVTVVAKIINVSSLSLSIAELTLTEGDSETIIATVKPDNATDKTVTWSTSDESIATVDGGKITAIKEGTATITAKAGDKTSTCSVTVEHDTMTDAIAFADSAIKEALIKSFDKNGDGELSYGEAASVKSIEGVFGTMKTYTSFEEFQYFTGITSIPQSMFEGWQIVSITLPESLTSIGKSAFKACTKLSSLVIPENINAIQSNTFRECFSLQSIVIPKTVSSIGSYAFFDCSSLSSITIPESVQSIEAYTFANCSSLSSIIIPNTVKRIGNRAFNNCVKLASVEIPDSVAEIDIYAFGGCTGLCSVTLPSSIYRIEDGTFFGCSGLSSINIPESVVIIGRHAFSGCSSLTSIIIPESVTSIGEGAFVSCRNLTTIVIPDGITRIENETFGACNSLKSINLPMSVISIGAGAFSNSGLVSIELSKFVTDIGNSAFLKCWDLVSISVNALIPPKIGSNVFTSTKDCPIYVPAESIEAYKTAEYWSDYADRIKAISSN